MALKKNFKKIRNFFCAACTFTFILTSLSSCKKEADIQNTEDSFELNIKESLSDENLIVPSWNFSEKKICILFGYGYNDEKFLEEIKQKLSDEFGLAQDGGKILPLVFPKDFKIAGRERISLLSDVFDDYDISGLVLLGAPENTHNVLGHLILQYDGQLPFPVFSMFSQDNVLGTEWVSDFVLEKMNVSDIFSDVEEKLSPSAEDSEALILRAVKYMTLLDGPLQKDSDLITHVQKIVGENHKVSYYVDSDTALRSTNHFVFQDIEESK